MPEAPRPEAAFPNLPFLQIPSAEGLAGRVGRAKRNRKHRTQRNAEAPPRSNRPASNRSLDRKTHENISNHDLSFEKPSWADELDCAVTLCDTEGIVCYQNERSRAVNGDVRGQSLLPCHNDRSREIIRHLLETGSRNDTIEKHGIRKLIYQTVWREDGEVRVLVEFSMEIPGEMPHYIRN